MIFEKWLIVLIWLEGLTVLISWMIFDWLIGGLMVAMVGLIGGCDG